MPEHLIVIDGYNLIHRSAALKPGPERTLRESRQKLLNLLAWAIGSGDAEFLVVFDGAVGAGRDDSAGRVRVRYSKPPRKADDDIREIVEERVDRVTRLTVVTSDLEVARHARAMGADVALADLFLASAVGPRTESGAPDAGSAEPERPAQISKKELEEWAEIFRSRRPRAEDPEAD